MVLAPLGDRISISSKIKEAEEKDRLRKIITPLLPKNFGCIIRTAAKGIKTSKLNATCANNSNVGTKPYS